MKELDECVPHEETSDQKNRDLKCWLNAKTMNRISTQLWRATKTRFLSNNWQWPAQWVDQEESLNLYQSKCHGHCLVVCGQPDPLQLSESKCKHYIWEVCSANRWDAPKNAKPVASTGQQKGPNYSPWQYQTIGGTTMLQKFYALGYKVLPDLLPYLPTLLPATSSSFLTTVCTKAASTTRMTKKRFSKSSWNPKSGFYTLKE